MEIIFKIYYYTVLCYSTVKQLKKDKERFEEQKAIEAAEKEKEEIVEMITKSGKSLDEIKKLLTK